MTSVPALRAELARLMDERDALGCDGSGWNPAADEYAEELDGLIADLRHDIYVAENPGEYETDTPAQKEAA